MFTFRPCNLPATLCHTSQKPIFNKNQLNSIQHFNQPTETAYTGCYRTLQFTSLFQLTQRILLQHLGPGKWRKKAFLEKSGKFSMGPAHCQTSVFSSYGRSFSLILYEFSFQVKMYVNDFKDDIIVYCTQK